MLYFSFIFLPVDNHLTPSILPYWLGIKFLSEKYGLAIFLTDSTPYSLETVEGTYLLLLDELVEELS